ncbi:MAG TPA: secretin N-terminal domain-containing protein [Chondromyces sp.]|nr:secretin N-terminal domain-containing protein [Chondromyces sp.]
MYLCRTSRSWIPTALLGAVLTAGIAGCSTAKRTADEGMDAFQSQNWDAAVYHYLQALAEEPDNVEYKMQLAFARQKAAQKHFENGMALRRLGRLLAARDELRMAVQLDPTNQYAEQVLEDVIADMEVLSTPDGARKLEELKAEARQAKVRPPILDPRSKEPITLNFPKPKPVKEIYDAIGKAYGFNALFDPKLKDDRLSIELRDLSAEQSLEMVMQAAGHFYKVLDPHSIIIAEDTPQNRRDYEDLVIKTFFLSNADVKEIDKLLRSLIEARRLSTNEQLNAITLRDTADKVAIAEKLIRVNDKAKAEVLVDVEILIMTSTKNTDIGTALSTYNFNLQLDTGAINPDTPEGSLGLDDFANISRGDWFINVPSVIINLAKSSGEAEVLAQPQLRITEGEKASLLIGDQVPIPVTAFNTSNTAGGNVVPITSFQYKDVGIQIEVEPRVHHNREITLVLKVEISNLGDTVPVSSDQEAISIGTRTITSTIRLKSGESSLLAGLIRRDKTKGVVKTPLLGDIPFLGRLFRSESTTNKDTDLVLTLTPQIIRFPDIEEEDLAPVWVGTESRISYFGATPRVQSGRADRGPFDAGQGSEEEEAPPEDESGTPYGTPASRRPTAPRRVEPPTQSPGVDLVPSGDDKRGSIQSGLEGDVGWGDVPGFEPVADSDDSGSPPLLVGLEPSVVSLRPGQETVLQVVVQGGAGSYRLPLGLSFDPRRLWIVGLRPAPGVEILREDIDPAGGWIELDMVVTNGIESGQAVAALEVQALEAGPVPLVFTSAGAITADGVSVPVAASDGALFVTGGGSSGNRP